MNTREIERLWKIATNNPNHDTNWHDPAVEKFAALVFAHKPPPESWSTYQEGYAGGFEAGQRTAFSKAEYTIGIDTADRVHTVVVFRNIPGQPTTLVAHAQLPETQT